MLIFAGVWLLVIGYGLTYIGYKNLGGGSVSFQQAFFPKGLFGGPSSGPEESASGAAASAASAAAANPVQSRGGSLVSA